MRSLGLLKILSSLAGCDITFQPKPRRYDPEGPDAGRGGDVFVAKDTGDAAEVSVEEDANTGADIPVREDVPVNEDVPVQEDAGSDAVPDAGEPVSVLLLSPLRGAVKSEEDQYVFTGRLDNAPGHGPIQCGFVFFREDQKNPVGNLATVTSPETDGDEITARLDGGRLETFQRFCWGIAACADQETILWEESVYEEGNHLCVTALPTGLVHYWSFDTLEEGEIVPDLSEYNHEGILSGIPVTNNAGVSGNALSLDGANDHVTTRQASPLGIADSWTVSFWIYREQADSDVLFAIGNTQAPHDYKSFTHVGVNNEGNIGLTTYGDEGDIHQGRFEEALSRLGVWQHFVLTKNAEDYRLFINGANIEISWINNAGENMTPQTDRPRFVRIGEGLENSGFFLGAKVDEFLIYDYPLEAGAIAALCRRHDPTGDTCPAP